MRWDELNEPDGTQYRHRFFSDLNSQNIQPNASRSAPAERELRGRLRKIEIYHFEEVAARKYWMKQLRNKKVKPESNTAIFKAVKADELKIIDQITRNSVTQNRAAIGLLPKSRNSGSLEQSSLRKPIRNQTNPTRKQEKIFGLIGTEMFGLKNTGSMNESRCNCVHLFEFF